MRRLALAVPAAALAALAAGCGGGTTTATGATGSTGAPGSTTPPATVTDTVVPPTTTTTAAPATATAGPAGPAACATVNLAVSLGQGNGAAGSTIYPLHFVNRGGSACTLTGYPGVSQVAPGDGKQVGQPAVRSSGSTATVTLSPGGEATALVKLSNYADYTPSACDATAVSGLRVYPPQNTAAAYIAFPSPTEGCTSGPTQLNVQPVEAGSAG